MRIAVLGAGGFIGHRATELLVLQGFEVRPVVRSAPSLALSARLGVVGSVADARDYAALVRAFEGCSTVVHSIAGTPAEILAGVEPVYRAAERAGVRRLVYLSSASVHGQSPALGTTEKTPLSTHQPIAYNAAKVRAERRLARLHARGSVELVVLRPGIVYGPRSRWVADFADSVALGRAFLINDGAGICNAIYVDNLVEAIRLAILTGHADGRTYIVGDAETVTWADLFRPIIEYFGEDARQLPEPALSRPEGLVSQLSSFARDKVRSWLRGVLPLPARVGLKAYFAARGSGEKASDVIVASEETRLLQTCSVKLSHELAATELGYRPIVTFAEAARNTIAWLDFAGYREFGQLRAKRSNEVR